MVPVPLENDALGLVIGESRCRMQRAPRPWSARSRALSGTRLELLKLTVVKLDSSNYPEAHPPLGLHTFAFLAGIGSPPAVGDRRPMQLSNRDISIPFGLRVPGIVFTRSELQRTVLPPCADGPGYGRQTPAVAPLAVTGNRVDPDMPAHDQTRLDARRAAPPARPSRRSFDCCEPSTRMIGRLA